MHESAVSELDSFILCGAAAWIRQNPGGKSGTQNAHVKRLGNRYCTENLVVLLANLMEVNYV